MLRCLISLVKWVFVNFPLTFPLLFAFFFLVHINSVFAADQIPADSVPAGVCEQWEAGDGVNKRTGCSAEEAVKAWQAAIGVDWPSNRCKTEWTKDCKALEPVFYYGNMYTVPVQLSYCSDMRTNTSGNRYCHVSWTAPIYREERATKVGPSYFCPPDNNAAYSIGPLTDENGAKWCAKSPDSCSSLAGTELPDWQWFFADFGTCTNGCLLRPNQGPSGIGVYVYHEYKGNRVYRQPLGAIHTGESCDLGASTDSDSDGDSDQPSDSDPATEQAAETGEKDCQLTYSSATGQSTCSASHDKTGDGTKCGYINGVWTCVDAPYTQGTQTDKTGQANGDGTATETTDKTVTECIGDDCTTESTTTTTTGPIGGSGPGGGVNGGDGGTGDGEGEGDGECTGDKCAIPGEGEPASWWESSYPDGIEGVWSDFAGDIQQTEFLQFVRQFEVDVGGGAPPDFNICFTALVDLGCHSIAPPDFVWSVMRLFMLITAAFTCRKLIFGG